jgi:hypothetical protein
MERITSTKDLAYAILGTNRRGLPLLQNGLHLPQRFTLVVKKLGTLLCGAVCLVARLVLSL